MSTSTFPRFAGDATTPFMAQIAEALVQQGVEVDVLAPHAPGSRARDQLAAGLNIYRFRYAWPESAEDICYGAGALENLKAHPLRMVKLPQLVAAQAIATARLLRERRHDLIHAHWLLPQGFSALAPAATGTPLVVSAHGSDIFGLGGAAAGWCKRQVIRRAAALTANSAAVAKELERLGADAARIEIIRIGASMPRREEGAAAAARQPGPRPPVLLFVGRLIEVKGADDAITAMSLLQDRLPGTRLVIAGDGPLRGGLERLAEQGAARGLVEFTGWLQPRQVRERMQQADILVMASRQAADGTREAQGVVPIEAMLTGLPVIATASGGLPEFVRDGETGLLVGERSPQDIADAVLRLWSDDGLMQRITGNARRWAESEGTIECTARHFAELYQRILG